MEKLEYTLDQTKKYSTIYLVDKTVREYKKFMKNPASGALAVGYSYGCTRDQLADLLGNQNLSDVNRLGLIFDESNLRAKKFLNNEPMFVESDLIDHERVNKMKEQMKNIKLGKLKNNHNKLNKKTTEETKAVKSTTNPVVEAVVEPVVEAVDKPVVEPVVEPVDKPVVEPVVEPVDKPVVEPVVEAVVEQVAEPAAEPVVEAVVEPVVEPAAEPVVEAVVEPVVEPAAEPVAEPVAKAVVEPAAEPVVEPVAKAVVEPVVEPVLRSPNAQFLMDLPARIVNIDFLACNSLNYNKWVKFYNILKPRVVGASNDKTGNIKYSGDWVMETTGQDISKLYFSDISTYSSTLVYAHTDVYITEDRVLTQSDFPLIANESSPSPIVYHIRSQCNEHITVTLSGPITIDDPGYYLSIESDNVSIKGKPCVLTFTDDVTDYAGFIKNGSQTEAGFNNICISGIDVSAGTEGTLADGAGWIAQQYFGNNARDNRASKCINNAWIHGSGSAGIIGANATCCATECVNNGEMIVGYNSVFGVFGVFAFGGIFGSGAVDSHAIECTNNGYINTNFSAISISFGGIFAGGVPGILGEGEDILGGPAPINCCAVKCYNSGDITLSSGGGSGYGGFYNGIIEFAGIIGSGGAFCGSGPVNCRAIKCTNIGNVISNITMGENPEGVAPNLIIDFAGIIGSGGSSIVGAGLSGGSGPVNCRAIKCHNTGGISGSALILEFAGIIGSGGALAFSFGFEVSSGSGPVNCQASKCSNEGGISGDAYLVEFAGIIGSGGALALVLGSSGSSCGSGPVNCRASKCSNIGDVTVNANQIIFAGIIGSGGASANGATVGGDSSYVGGVPGGLGPKKCKAIKCKNSGSVKASLGPVQYGFDQPAIIQFAGIIGSGGSAYSDNNEFYGNNEEINNREAIGGSGPEHCCASKCCNSGSVESDGIIIDFSGIIGSGGSAYALGGDGANGAGTTGASGDNGGSVTASGGAGPVDCKASKCKNSGDVKSDGTIIEFAGVIGSGGSAYAFGGLGGTGGTGGPSGKGGTGGAGGDATANGGSGPADCKTFRCSNSGKIQGNGTIIEFAGVIGSGGSAYAFGGDGGSGGSGGSNSLAGASGTAGGDGGAGGSATSSGGAGPANCKAIKCSNSGNVEGTGNVEETCTIIDFAGVIGSGGSAYAQGGAGGAGDKGGDGESDGVDGGAGGAGGAGGYAEANGGTGPVDCKTLKCSNTGNIQGDGTIIEFAGVIGSGGSVYAQGGAGGAGLVGGIGKDALEDGGTGGAGGAGGAGGYAEANGGTGPVDCKALKCSNTGNIQGNGTIIVFVGIIGSGGSVYALGGDGNVGGDGGKGGDGLAGGDGGDGGKGGKGGNATSIGGLGPVNSDAVKCANTENLISSNSSVVIIEFSGIIGSGGGVYAQSGNGAAGGAGGAVGAVAIGSGLPTFGTNGSGGNSGDVTSTGTPGPKNCRVLKCLNSCNVNSGASILEFSGIVGTGGAAYVVLGEFGLRGYGGTGGAAGVYGNADVTGGAGPENIKCIKCANTGHVLGGDINILEYAGILGSAGSIGWGNDIPNLTPMINSGPVNCQVIKCANSGGVTSDSIINILNFGGIIGGVNTILPDEADEPSNNIGSYKCQVMCSYNVGGIQNSAGEVTNVNFGGIYAYNINQTQLCCAECSYNYGSIGTIGTSEAGCVINYGGIYAGNTDKSRADFCYNQGNCTSEENVTVMFGGIFGPDNTGASANNCYNSTDLLATNTFYGILGSDTTMSTIVNCYVSSSKPSDLSNPLCPSETSIIKVNSSGQSEATGSWSNKSANRYIGEHADHAWIKHAGEHDPYYLKCFTKDFYKEKITNISENKWKITNAKHKDGTYYLGEDPLHSHLKHTKINEDTGTIRIDLGDACRKKIIVIYIADDTSYRIDYVYINVENTQPKLI